MKHETLQVVNTSVPKVDGVKIVTGAAKYTANEIAMRKAADLPVD